LCRARVVKIISPCDQKLSRVGNSLTNRVLLESAIESSADRGRVWREFVLAQPGLQWFF